MVALLIQCREDLTRGSLFDRAYLIGRDSKNYSRGFCIFFLNVRREQIVKFARICFPHQMSLDNKRAMVCNLKQDRFMLHREVDSIDNVRSVERLRMSFVNPIRISLMHVLKNSLDDRCIFRDQHRDFIRRIFRHPILDSLDGRHERIHVSEIVSPLHRPSEI